MVRVVVVAVPGAGKSTILKKLVEKISGLKIVNFGDYMFEEARKALGISDRDEMRKRIKPTDYKQRPEGAAGAGGGRGEGGGGNPGGGPGAGGGRRRGASCASTACASCCWICGAIPEALWTRQSGLPMSSSPADTALSTRVGACRNSTRTSTPAVGRSSSARRSLCW